MKNILLVVLVIGSINIGYGQKYIDEIAEATCTCIIELENELEVEVDKARLGLCMINSCQPYAKKIKKDFKIDINDPGGNGRLIGGMVGERMAFLCPDAILGRSERHKNKEKEIEGLLTFEGVIVEIEETNFVIFSIENKDGKIMKFRWLGFVENEVDLVDDYKRLESASVKVSYVYEEYFFPEFGKYLATSVLKKMEWLD